MSADSNKGLSKAVSLRCIKNLLEWRCLIKITKVEEMGMIQELNHEVDTMR